MPFFGRFHASFYFLSHIKLVHDLIPSGLIGQLIENLPG